MDETPIKKKRGRKKNIYNTSVEVVNNSSGRGTHAMTIQSKKEVLDSPVVSFPDFFKGLGNNSSEKSKDVTKTLTAQERGILYGLNKQSNSALYKDVDTITTTTASGDIQSESNIFGSGEETIRHTTSAVSTTDTKDLNTITKLKQIGDSKNFKCISSDNCCTFCESHYNSPTDILCWYCCHSFDTLPVPLPYSYKKVNGVNTYVINGNFCSFNCAKTYNLQCTKSSVDKHNVCTMLTSLQKSIFGCIKPIQKAQQRELLQAFGGVLTIEEFRNMSKNDHSTRKLQICPKMIIPKNMVLYSERLQNSSLPFAGEDREPTNSNGLKLFRKTPLKTKNTLEATMGIKLTS